MASEQASESLQTPLLSASQQHGDLDESITASRRTASQPGATTSMDYDKTYVDEPRISTSLSKRSPADGAASNGLAMSDLVFNDDDDESLIAESTHVGSLSSHNTGERPTELIPCVGVCMRKRERVCVCV